MYVGMLFTGFVPEMNKYKIFKSVRDVNRMMPLWASFCSLILSRTPKIAQSYNYSEQCLLQWLGVLIKSHLHKNNLNIICSLRDSNSAVR